MSYDHGVDCLGRVLSGLVAGTIGLVVRIVVVGVIGANPLSADWDCYVFGVYAWSVKNLDVGF